MLIPSVEGKQCNQSLTYSTSSKVAGTSRFKRHIAKGACETLLHGQDQNTYAHKQGGLVLAMLLVHQRDIVELDVKLKYFVNVKC